MARWILSLLLGLAMGAELGLLLNPAVASVLLTPPSL